MSNFREELEKIIPKEIRLITNDKGETVEVDINKPKRDAITKLVKGVIGEDEWVDPDMRSNKPEDFKEGYPEDPIVKPWTRNNLREEQRQKLEEVGK